MLGTSIRRVRFSIRPNTFSDLSRPLNSHDCADPFLASRVSDSTSQPSPRQNLASTSLALSQHPHDPTLSPLTSSSPSSGIRSAVLARTTALQERMRAHEAVLRDRDFLRSGIQDIVTRYLAAGGTGDGDRRDEVGLLSDQELLEILREVCLHWEPSRDIAPGISRGGSGRE